MKEQISNLKNVKESDPKRPFTCIGLLKSLQARVAKNGSGFFMIEFGDYSGTLSTMSFEGSSTFAILNESKIGDAFQIEGSTDFYQGRFSPKIDTLRRIDDDELNTLVEYLAQVSPYDPEDMKVELYSIIDRIENENLRNTVLYAIDSVGDSFFKSTAAVKMHHAYIYGLLEHSLKVSRMAVALLPLYPYVDADLSIAGCVLHDIGKVIEYTQGLVSDRTRIGILQGHVVLGYRIVRKAGIKNGLNDDILERLEHIILSHQGELEWGAAARAATPEALFVSNIDNFDAKMGAIESALSISNDKEFVDVPALKSKILTTKPNYNLT